MRTRSEQKMDAGIKTFHQTEKLVSIELRAFVLVCRQFLILSKYFENGSGTKASIMTNVFRNRRQRDWISEIHSSPLGSLFLLAF